MKKFFRTLALVLALTLVIGTIPAAAADEVKPLTKKTLYIGGAQGTNADGKQSTYKAKVALYKLAGYKTKAAAEGVAISAVAADEKVRVTKSYVYAEELGKTNVTLTVDGVESSVAITVKKNAEAVKVVGLEEGEVVVGTTVEFSLPRKGSDTDARRVTVNGTALDDIEGKDRCYSYKFEKTGEYEFVLEAFQSKYYPVATAKETVKVTVVEPNVVSAKQVASNKVAVTFDCDVTNAISAASFETGCVYYKVSDIAIAAGLIKGVDIDKEVATVELYQNFAEKSEYFVKVAGQETSFKTAENDIRFVESIKLFVKDVVAGEPIEISYVLKNADGVELSIPGANPDITVESDFGAPDFTPEGKPAIYMYEADKPAKIKGVISIGYNEETFELITREDTLDIVSVAKKTAEVSGKIYGFGADVTKEVHSIRLDATTPSALKAKYSYDDNTSKVVDFSDTDKYYIQIADQTKAMANSSNEIFGVNQGTTVVIVYTKADDKVFDAFEINVLEANKSNSATIELTGNKSKVNLANSDAATLKVEVKDLDGNTVDSSKYTVEVKQVENNAKATGYALDDDSTTFNKSSIKKVSGWTGEYTATSAVKFTVTVKDKASSAVIAKKDLIVTVANINDNEPGKTYTYNLKASEPTLNSSLTAANPALTDKESEIKVEKTYNGFYIGNESFFLLEKLSDLPTTASEGSYNYVVLTTPEKADKVDLVTSAATKTVTSDSITIKNFATGKALVAGNYVAVGYRLTFGANEKVVTGGKQSMGQAMVTVTKNDSPATVTVVKGDAASAVSGSAFVGEWCGKKTNDETPVIEIAELVEGTNYVKDTDGTVYVYYVEVVTKPDGSYGTNKIKVQINKAFKP